MGSRSMVRLLALAALLGVLPVAGTAHVGNPDIYFDGQAGPYKLFVTIRPPVVIPGVAEIEVRAHDSGVNAQVRSLEAVPIPLNAEEAKFAPVPDALKVSGEDRQFFTGSLWIMAAGSWQVRITADGAAGRATLAVPVPSVARTTKKMQWGLGAGLTTLTVLLVAGLVLIVGASAREAQLEPAAQPTEAQRARARRSMAVTFVVVASVLGLGWWWWNASEAQYRRNIFSPFRMQADLSPAGLLKLSLSDPSAEIAPASARLKPAFFTRTTDDLILDHEHLMHLYALREPGLDIVYHLHPQMTGPGQFRLQMPETEPGRYRLYADIVHANGFPETPVANIDVPAGLPGRALAGDDARGVAPPWQTSEVGANTFRLPDGYSMMWVRPAGVLRTRDAQEFRFVLLNPQGQAPSDMRFYMGMPGHAAFVNTDGSAFAHIHPAGTVSMASLMMAEEQLPNKASDKSTASMAMTAGNMPGVRIPNAVVFPYGFPTAGHYRIIVQMKHGETIETGIFDTDVQDEGVHHRK